MRLFQIIAASSIALVALAATANAQMSNDKQGSMGQGMSDGMGNNMNSNGMGNNMGGKGMGGPKMAKHSTMHKKMHKNMNQQ